MSVAIVGIDTATSATSVAVLVPGGRRSSGATTRRRGERPRHAETLLPLLEQALAQAEVGWESVARICVGTGPGGFTGLRLGISTARALSQGHDLPLVGVSSLEALARGIELVSAGARPAGPPGRARAGAGGDRRPPRRGVRRPPTGITARRWSRSRSRPPIWPSDWPPARVGTQPDDWRRGRGGTLSGGARAGRSGGAVRRFPGPPRQRADDLPAGTGEGARRPRLAAPGLPPRAGRRPAFTRMTGAAAPDPPLMTAPPAAAIRGPPTHVRRPARGRRHRAARLHERMVARDVRARALQAVRHLPGGGGRR